MSEFFRQFFDFGFMAEHFDEVLDGFWWTIQLSVVSGALALAWGLILATLRQLPGRVFLPVRALTVAYIDVFRGIPLLLLILLIYGGFTSLDFLPESLRLPQWLGKPDNFWFGVAGLTITYGAYMAEVYRAGIEAVPPGQMEAARSLGMNHGQAMRSVILPQAVRKVIAPLLNDFIALTKDTTLVSVIALNEVVLVGSDIQAETFNSSALTLGAIMFLVVTLPLARLVDKLISREQSRFTRGAPRVEAL
ncbi:MAG TPA: amino acid ABC transporter permease [Solirubrobacterales bacterium]